MNKESLGNRKLDVTSYDLIAIVVDASLGLEVKLGTRRIARKIDLLLEDDFSFVAVLIPLNDLVTDIVIRVELDFDLVNVGVLASKMNVNVYIAGIGDDLAGHWLFELDLDRGDVFFFFTADYSHSQHQYR